jgi:hypothetical protein
MVGSESEKYCESTSASQLYYAPHRGDGQFDEREPRIIRKVPLNLRWLGPDCGDLLDCTAHSPFTTDSCPLLENHPVLICPLASRARWPQPRDRPANFEP